VTQSVQPGTERTTKAARSRRRKWFGIAFSVVFLIAVFGFLLPKLADYDDIWTDVSSLDATSLVALAVVGVASLFALVPVVMTSLPGTRFWEAFVDLTAGTTAANTVPGGSAIGIGINWAIFDSWGFTPQEYTLATLVSGAWNNFVKLSLPVISLVLLALDGDLRSSFIPAAIVGIAVMAAVILLFALVLKSEELASAVGRRLGKIVEAAAKKVHRTVQGDTWGEKGVEFRARSIDLIRRRWPALTITSLIGQLSLWLVLLVSVRAVGISEAEVSWIEVLASFAFVRLISAIPITPGGLGVVELGLTAALASGESTALTTKAAAAVLIYRALTFLLPIPVGAGCYVFWRVNKSWRRTPEERARTSKRPRATVTA
jgi:uncharacterized membrane protein YbhN (UPF0104 family)